MRTRFLAVLLLVSTAALAGGGEFDRVVKAIESHYGTKRTHIPFMGVANLFLKVGHPAGTSSVKLAIFEDLRSSSEDEYPIELDRFMKESTAGGMRPLIRVHSRNGESTYIYTGEAGKSTRMLIATFQRDEATVIEATVNVDTLVKLLERPEIAGSLFSTKDGTRDDR
jgi:hypothetical protein